MKRFIKYVLLVVVIALVGYKSVYFKKLSTMGTTGTAKFDAVAFTNKLWNEKLTAKLDSAVDLSFLLNSISSNPEEGFKEYSHALAIGNYRYSLANFVARVDSVNEDDILISTLLHEDTILKLRLATEYIYGNAIRDASNLVDIRDFTNATDLNNISEELNKKVRMEILPPFRKRVKVGDAIEVTGAIKFNKAHIDFSKLEILPLQLKIQ